MTIVQKHIDAPEVWCCKQPWHHGELVIWEYSRSRHFWNVSAVLTEICKLKKRDSLLVPLEVKVGTQANEPGESFAVARFVCHCFFVGDSLVDELIECFSE